MSVCSLWMDGHGHAIICSFFFFFFLYTYLLFLSMFFCCCCCDCYLNFCYFYACMCIYVCVSVLVFISSVGCYRRDCNENTLKIHAKEEEEEKTVNTFIKSSQRKRIMEYCRHIKYNLYDC